MLKNSGIAVVVCVWDGGWNILSLSDSDRYLRAYRLFSDGLQSVQ